MPSRPLKEKGKQEDEEDEQDAKRRRESTKASFVELVSQTRDKVNKALLGTTGEDEASPTELIEQAFQAQVRSSDALLSQLRPPSYKSGDRNLKVQANWFNVKLETARVAAETRLEHTKLEVKAAEAANLTRR